MLAIKQSPRGEVLKPLSIVTITGGEAGSEISVRDGQGREYVRRKAGKTVSFKAGGALGNHLVMVEDISGKVIDSVSFNIDCETEINDKGGLYKDLLGMLHWTMIGMHGETGTIHYKNKLYHFFVCWLRDHVHTMKGMKYFYEELKTGIDLYADSQRKDGMIWDNVKARGKEKGMWDTRFEYGGFIMPAENSTIEFKRIPVENDVEYLFLEGLYYTWKACGDDRWMEKLLDNAIRAVNYSITDEYRWSKKFKLLKRGYTIDTWDFQNAADAATFKSDAMCVHPEKSNFGVMHGDNTGMAIGCQYLAEMLGHVGREKEAAKYKKLGENILERLNKLAWNGKFFTHHVPENGKTRDFGVDEKKQVSLSNSYGLNRGISHKQAVGIIKTYQDIRKKMPKSSPGEWYQIYPPFEKGFGGHGNHWEYMNGGVTTIVAGELAHGAFEHGFEDYGVDILKRLIPIGKRDDNYFHCCYRGAMPSMPKRKFTPVDLSGVANADFKGKTVKGVLGWTGEGDNDLYTFPTGKRKFNEIPFDIIDPKKNGRRAVLALSSLEGFASKASVAVGKKAKSVYFLHTMGGGPLAGSVTIKYKDGTEFSDFIRSPKIFNWWGAGDPVKLGNGGRRNANCRLAWTGANKKSNCLGVYEYGLNNPNPNKEIASLEFEASREDTRWMVMGVTLCDYEVFFMPSHVSFGIPDNWGAAAVVYALIEGLGGIKDTGVAYDKVLLAPRWTAAGVDKVEMTAKYPASGGYVSYKYDLDRKRKIMTVEFTGNTDNTNVELLLPSAKKPKTIKLNGEEVKFKLKTVEKSTYASFAAEGLGANKIEVKLG